METIKMTQKPSTQATALERAIPPQCTEIRIRGKTIAVPSVRIRGRSVIVTGKWLKIAAVEDEDCLEGEVVDTPDIFVSELKRSSLQADLFTFQQKPEAIKSEYPYHTEVDNAAIIPIKDYTQWWEGLPQETRRNVRKAAKSGVEVKAVPYDDALVRGIVDIYNETPIRQGKKFWHYGKSFEAVKKETSTYLERSEFVGAYVENELIGFVKMLYVDSRATIIHILSKEQHAEKKPTNALIAKAVEICAQKGMTAFQYCKYVYGGNEGSSLTEFKRRNGFERVDYPRYYVPLSGTGKLVLKLKLHHGIFHLLPETMLSSLRGLRKRILAVLCRPNLATVKSE
jgi:hypothetical protein